MKLIHLYNLLKLTIQSKKQPKFISVMIGLLLTNTVIAADCQECIKVQTGKEIQLKYLEQTKKYLLMNENFLTKLNPSETSKLTKVRSNIIVGNIQIETIQNRILAHDNDLKTKDCASCAGT